MNQVAPAFTQVLERHRSELNACFQLARQLAPALEGEEFLYCLRTFVAPLVERCDATFSERTDEVGVVLYDIALQLWSKGLLGRESRCAALNKAWLELLPELSKLIVQSPKRVVGSVCNAVVQLAQTRGVRVDEWIDKLRNLAPLCQSVDELLEVGRVLAWRCGLAHGRSKALHACWSLSPEIVCAALEVGEENRESTILQLERDLWYSSTHASTQVNTPLQLVAQVGGFTGFGGEFALPPQVVLWNGSLYVSDGNATEGEKSWRIFADRFGATLVRASLPAQQPKTSLDNTTLHQILASLPEAKNLQSWASDGRTLAVTVSTSHHVFLFA